MSLFNQEYLNIPCPFLEDGFLIGFPIGFPSDPSMSTGSRSNTIHPLLPHFSIKLSPKISNEKHDFPSI